MNAVVKDVFQIKGRGTAIQVDDETPPIIGEVYSCGNDSWKIRSVEFVTCANNTSYYIVLVKAIDKSRDPAKGYILDKITS